MKLTRLPTTNKILSLNPLSLYKIMTFCNLFCLLQLSNALFASPGHIRVKKESPIEDAQVRLLESYLQGNMAGI